MITTRRTLDFPSGLAKARYLDFWARVEKYAAPIQRLAPRFMTLPLERRADAIHAHVRDSIGYQRDPNRQEELADAGAILSRTYDDCDGKSRVFVSLCLACGLDARIMPVYRGANFSHVQAQVRWPGSCSDARADADGWILAELILRGTPLGSGVETLRRDERGAPLYAGPQQAGPSGTYPAR